MSDALPPVRLFYSYAHEDEALRKKLETHLKLLVRQGLIEDWKDRQIEAGAEWNAEIKPQLDEADIIVLLVSPDFMASDYIWGKELGTAMERHRQSTARVLPVIIRPTELKGAQFMHLQALPRDGKPVVTWPNLDEAWVDVASGIRQVAERLRVKKAAQAGGASPAPAGPR